MGAAIVDACIETFATHLRRMRVRCVHTILSLGLLTTAMQEAACLIGAGAACHRQWRQPGRKASFAPDEAGCAGHCITWQLVLGRLPALEPGDGFPQVTGPVALEHPYVAADQLTGLDPGSPMAASARLSSAVSLVNAGGAALRCVLVASVAEAPHAGLRDGASLR